MGTVVSTTGEIRDIATGSARVTAGGTVTAKLGDYLVCCDDGTPPRWQTRGFRWQHSRFAQVSGPTAMPANPAVTETRVTAGELVLGPVVDGYRYGTVPVTVAHRWGSRPPALTVYFSAPDGLERAGSAWPPVTVGPGPFRITVDPPPARGSRTLRFAFRRPATVTGGDFEVALNGAARSGASLGEAVPFDNTAAVPIRTVS